MHKQIVEIRNNRFASFSRGDNLNLSLTRLGRRLSGNNLGRKE